MATEIKSISEPRWPSSVRLPVVLTFEHQSGEGAPLLPGDRPNYMVGGAMQYGARTGVWNILELLDKLGVKAVPVQLPIGAESSFVGVVDLVHLRAYVWKGEELVLRSERGYTGDQSRLQMLQNKEFIDAKVEIFGKHGSRLWVKLGEFKIDRQLLTE